MNTHEISCHDDKHMSLMGCSLDRSASFYQKFSARQLCNMGFSFQFPLPEGIVHQNIPRRPRSHSSDLFSCLEGGSPPLSFIPTNSSYSDSNCFESQSSSFYDDDRSPGFPPYVYQVGTLPSFSQLSPICSAEFPSPWPSEGQFFVDLPNQNDVNQHSRTFDHFGKFQHRKSQDSELPPFIQSKPGKGYASDGEGFHNPSIGCNPFNPTKFLKTSRGVSVSSSNDSSSKIRIRWTQELHERFVESVNHLGGAKKATPKGILRLMGTDGLTVFHVKSHLQKFRIAKDIPDSAEGKFERKASTIDIPQFDLKTMQITEALRLQIDVQMRLHEQLEIQRKLQVQIEEQGKQLQKMFDQQQKAKSNLFETQKLDVLFPGEEPVCLEDVQIQGVNEGFENTHFPIKIT
ncbi:uncharacterized protein LOC143845556 isoform X2 [Tasmannia lanceolata]|uniref:uncharacterized protein LOC143845556 isoform X2 n=1 Tax=Tasmannia lanceolata TaxID=3420 RepID=UPI004062E66E